MLLDCYSQSINEDRCFIVHDDSFGLKQVKAATHLEAIIRYYLSFGEVALINNLGLGFKWVESALGHSKEISYYCSLIDKRCPDLNLSQFIPQIITQYEKLSLL